MNIFNDKTSVVVSGSCLCDECPVVKVPNPSVLLAPLSSRRLLVDKIHNFPVESIVHRHMMSLLRAHDDGILEALDDDFCLVVPLVLLSNDMETWDFDALGRRHSGLTGLPFAPERRSAAHEHKKLEPDVGLVLLQPLDQVDADLGTLREGDDAHKGALLVVHVDQLGQVGPFVVLDLVVVVPLLVALAVPQPLSKIGALEEGQHARAGAAVDEALGGHEFILAVDKDVELAGLELVNVRVGAAAVETEDLGLVVPAGHDGILDLF